MLLALLEPAGSSLDETTLIPLGIAAAIVLFAIGAAWRLSATLTKIELRLASIQHTLDGHWTLKDQLGWAMELKEKNPSMNVPRPGARDPEAAQQVSL